MSIVYTVSMVCDRCGASSKKYTTPDKHTMAVEVLNIGIAEGFETVSKFEHHCPTCTKELAI